MSELSYKELQEQGVFDVPYRAFEYMQSQQGEVDKLQTEIDELQARVVELTKTLSEVQMMSHKSISYEHDLFDKGWNQASKQVVINIHRLTGIGEGLLKWKMFVH